MIVRCELMTVRWMLVVLFTLSLSNVGAQAASFVVNSATALPSPVQIGQTLKMVGSVSASQNASNYMIGLFVYDVTTSTLTAYQAFTGLNFVVGTPITEEFDWTVPGGTSLTDSYEFAVAIFDSNSVYQNAEYIVPLTIASGSPPPANGTCGLANGVPVSAAPTTGLCSTGTPSAITGTGPWTWSCNGGGGGNNASCSAPLQGSPTSSSYSVPQYTCVRNFYVATTGNDSNDGSLAHPWATPQRALAAGRAPSRVAGDCINLEPGSYSSPLGALDFETGGTNNSPTGYVVMRSVDSNGNYSRGTARLNFVNAGTPIVLKLMAPYEIVDGLEIDGNNDTASDQCVGNIDETAYPNTHHLVIENNIIHGCGGHGISLNYNEYWWVLGNTIYSNGGSGSQYYEAGVYVYAPQNEATISTGFSPNSADLALTYHITIAGNTIYNNFCHTNSCSGSGGNGQGHGIALDDLDNRTHGSVAYPYSTLAVGNYIYGNGGHCIFGDYSHHVTVANNSCYSNNLDTVLRNTDRGELESIQMPDAIWVNNIAYAVPGAGILANNVAMFSDSTTPAFQKNMTYNGTPGQSSVINVPVNNNLFGVNPLFVNPGSANLQLQSGSPALGTGLPEGFLSSGTPNIGAY